MGFRLPFDLIVLDLELNGDDIIQLGAVHFDRQGGISSNVFQSLVYAPGSPKNCFVIGKGQVSIEELCNLKWVDVQAAPTFSNVMTSFEEWTTQFGKNFYLASWGIGDVPCIRAAYEKLNLKYPFRGASYDIKSFVNLYSGMNRIRFKTTGLKSMMKAYEVTWDNRYGEQHNALADSYNTARLLQKVVNDYNNNVSFLKKIISKFQLSVV